MLLSIQIPPPSLKNATMFIETDSDILSVSPNEPCVRPSVLLFFVYIHMFVCMHACLYVCTYVYICLCYVILCMCPSDVQYK